MTKITPELLERYYQDNCTAEEKIAVERWILSEEADITLPSAERVDSLGAEIWEAVKPDTGQAAAKTAGYPYIRRYIAYGIAACLALILPAAWLYLNQDPVVINGGIAVHNSYNSIAMQNGERGRITLSDGTVVYLNSASELRYPDHFQDSVRVVYLSGEAYFEVAKDPLKPFIVHTAASDTRVLGTEFNLQAYDAGGSTVLTVSEGKVCFSSKQSNRSVIVMAGERAITAGALVSSGIATDNSYSMWKDNKLVIDDKKLTDLIPILERWYDITITLRSAKLKDLRYTGVYDNPALSEVLKSMSYTMKFNYRLQGQHLTIY